MQQINNNVHVKVQCDNDFRRFVLAEVTYINLATTIRTLLGLRTDSVLKLSYLDDENDWVYFTTDSELQHAVTLSKSPLKISVKLGAPATSETSVEEPVGPADEENTPRKWRGGKGGRGCRGGRGGACKVERIDAKVARLNERHAMLSAKLIEEDLPQEKARALEWRLSHLQNKIDLLKAKKEQLADACAANKQEHPCEATVSQTESDETPKDGADFPSEFPNRPHPRCHRRGGCGHGPHGRWGGRGYHRFGGEHTLGEGFPPHFPSHRFGGDHPHPPFHHHHHPHHHFGGEHPPHHPFGGCQRRERGEKGECERKKRCGGPAFVNACSIPEGKAAFERLHAAKEALVKARQEKAEKEVIMAKFVELKEAKAAWREIKWALWKEQKEQQHFAGCPRKQAK